MKENEEARCGQQTEHYDHGHVEIEDLAVRVDAEVYSEHYYKECKRYPPYCYSQEIILDKDHIQNVERYGQVLK